ncbi:hypothetical protein [Streptomyces sp. NPDC060035]|uniref:hypothetical protein n=1 Tax=Streptomyces sp. NPDC060035 TaxID=3347044 RepID=UPI0036743B54
MAEAERWWFRRQFRGEDLGDVRACPSDGDEELDGVDPADAERTSDSSGPKTPPAMRQWRDTVSTRSSHPRTDAP